MDRNGIDVLDGDESHPLAQLDVKEPILSSTFFLDQVGDVTLISNSNGLSWESAEPLRRDDSTCLGMKFFSNVPTEIKLSDIYGVELTNYGPVHVSSLPHARRRLLGHNVEMYRFIVHGVQRSRTQPSLWVPATYTFGHKNLHTCQMWVNQLNTSLNHESGRPKRLLVFVHPRSGKGNGFRTWETVAPIFLRASVETKVIMTQRAGHAFNVMASITNKELSLFDGVVAVGGDGFFNEILNGFLSSRHNAPKPLIPSDFLHYVGDNSKVLVQSPSETAFETQHQGEDCSGLLSSPTENASGVSNSSIEDSSNNAGGSADKAPDFLFPNEWFRFGIIPAGSTDAIVMCTTGSRDPITSALHIVLGKRVRLDIAQVIRWKRTPKSEVKPCMRYAASFAGYGFYGDVITESEKLRWMGPRRYDYAGTRVFLRHSSYEAEVAYIEAKSEQGNGNPNGACSVNHEQSLRSQNKPEKCICRVNCNVCNAEPFTSPGVPCRTTDSHPEERWERIKGRFLSVGAAIISCRNERAPDGLVADAHLSDGLLHLILIRDCPHAFYLWHLTQLARKGGKPLDFKFVEHHKTPAFTFTSFGNESVWNLDGELFQAHQLSAQVLRGLISLFASGPEV